MSENTPRVMPSVEKAPRGEKTPRLQRLADGDDRYTDSIAGLAAKEDFFRMDHLDQGMVGTDSEKRNRTADAFSDEVLGRMEAERARWIDDLTGLRNKNAYLKEVPQYIRGKKQQYERQRGATEEHRQGAVEAPVSPHCALLMIDFDHFKRVNDMYGHAAGDQALQQMARMIQDSVRSSDSVYRFGGEEFLVFLPDDTADQAKIVAEKIRQRVEESTISITDQDNNTRELKKTVSIGCVGTDQLDGWDSLPMDAIAEFSDGMTKYADQAVYSAKKGGRNRSVLYARSVEDSSGESVQ